MIKFSFWDQASGRMNVGEVNENSDTDTDDEAPATLAPATAALIMLVGENIPLDQRELHLRGTAVALGRGVANDITLNCLQISRKHCNFIYRNRQWLIQDLSTNGIFINMSNVSKTDFSPINEDDTLHLIPGGILTYRFKYLTPPGGRTSPLVPASSIPVSVPAARVPILTRNDVAGPSANTSPTGRLPVIVTNPAPRLSPLGTRPSNLTRLDVPGPSVQASPPRRSPTKPPSGIQLYSDDTGSDSEASESLLSVGTPESDERYRTALGEVEPEPTTAEDEVSGLSDFTPDSPDLQVIEPEQSSKRPYALVNQKKTVQNSKRLKPLTSVLRIDLTDTDSSDSEELPDIEEDPIDKRFPAAKQKPGGSKAGVSDSSSGSFTQSPTLVLPEKKPAVTSPVKVPDSAIDVDKMNDILFLRGQIKHFMEKCREVEADKKKVYLTCAMEKETLSKQLMEAKSEAQVHKEELFKDLIQVLEHELNCCICNEVFILATVIDCGHTFCHFCISEWSKKKSECPVCRSRISHRTKHVEMENFVVKVHGMMSEEIQSKRRLLIKDREEEILALARQEEAENVAAVEAAQAAVRGGRGGRRGGIVVGHHGHNFVFPPAHMNDFLAELMHINEAFDALEDRVQGRGQGAPTAAPPHGGRGRPPNRPVRVAAHNDQFMPLLLPEGGPPPLQLPLTSRRRGARARVYIPPMPPLPVPPPPVLHQQPQHQAPPAPARNHPWLRGEPQLITLDDSQDQQGMNGINLHLDPRLPH